ncbi:SsrA-binding protein [Pirellula sp. SH-Sr6A]|uniref:SsrA-binding protein SmpB n=1 Tax=Pirellula sp. SH-Sr6A TaxID=1632865 RepID=UPI00078E78A4|nr:SsrA-binding protein SmpB [Pirellula sp. SH-Sr6A]AMV32569.1 SsrA-binding protein [Pirellula sp. SH-Sr6A]
MSKKTSKPAQPTSSKPSAPKPKEKEKSPVFKSVTENRKAKFQYEILDSMECGIMLHGSEVKSLRNGKCSIEEAYGRLQNGELWLVNCEIDEYRQATFWNHPTKRTRKLLLRKQELLKFAGRSKERGLTLVPLRVYFTERGIAKCVMGLCKGKKLHDKRETLKKKDSQRDIERAMRGKRMER